ncbi:MAG: tyrosine-protein phosphatase [Blastocatellia bacterium]|nr:tyrosine-protein phosphatase [Blastocatellia bacterium]
MKPRFSRSLVLFALIIIGISASFAQTAPDPEKFASVKIINFGQMDDRYFRGGQPLPGDYQTLKDLGVNTVIDLRNDPTEYEKREVEALGMKYVNIPMSGWKWAKDDQVEEFLKVVNHPETGVVYAHCKAGRHRAGLIGAIYRFEKYGWDYDKVYQEMKNYNYSSWPWHHNIKSFVRDYAKRNKDSISAVASSVAALAN